MSGEDRGAVGFPDSRPVQRRTDDARIYKLAEDMATVLQILHELREDRSDDRKRLDALDTPGTGRVSLLEIEWRAFRSEMRGMFRVLALIATVPAILTAVWVALNIAHLIDPRLVPG